MRRFVSSFKKRSLNLCIIIIIIIIITDIITEVVTELVTSLEPSIDRTDSPPEPTTGFSSVTETSTRGEITDIITEVVTELVTSLEPSIDRTDSPPEPTTGFSTEPCSEGYYQCPDGSCINEELRCDYVTDCEDNSDEIDGCVCNPEIESQCASGGCVNVTWICDGDSDCFDGSDELNCTCSEVEYQCDDGTCISGSLSCDYIIDCGDNSDEIDCVCNPEIEYPCVSGGCVNVTWICDGELDCLDGSDEGTDLCTFTTSSSTEVVTNAKSTSTVSPVSISESTASLSPDIDDCDHSRCLHRSTCVDGINSYTCRCLDGYAGTHCELDIDDCAALRCLHGSSCIDRVGSYTCQCRPRFSGVHCENYCESDSDCDNGGTCDKGECVCSCEFHGWWCEEAARCFETSMTLVELDGQPIEFTPDLQDPNSQRFQDLVDRITPLIHSLIFATATAFKYYYTDSLIIKGFEEGSVKTIYQLQFSDEVSLTPEVLEEDIQRAISEGAVPQLGVKEGSVITKRVGGPPSTKPTKVFLYLGSGMALFAIICIFIRYMGNRALRADKENQLMLHLCVALSGLLIMIVLLAIFVDSTIEGLDIDKIGCYVLAGFTHYFFLVSGWLTVVQTLSLTRNQFKNGITVAVVFAWGIPLILVPIIGAISQDDYADQKFCMLREEVLLVTLVAPLGLFLLINIVLYIKNSKKRLVPIKQLKKTFAILFLVAIIWTSGILSFVPGVSLVSTRTLFFVCCFAFTFGLIIVYAKTTAKDLAISEETPAKEADPKGIELDNVVVEKVADSKENAKSDSEEEAMDSQNEDEVIQNDQDEEKDEKDETQDADQTAEDSELVKKDAPENDDKEEKGVTNEGFEKEDESKDDS
ncbi:uncharacterized protein [Amphiura filiformis]|uniref:uncharacterized protein n=1 Tax=Amphiura filiformis TaxID=82378 RepID=UPI003B21F43F